MCAMRAWVHRPSAPMLQPGGLAADCWRKPAGHIPVPARRRRAGAAGTSLGQVAYTSAEARQELLDAFAGAIGSIGLALAALGAAYEQLDEHTADRLEAGLLKAIPRAYTTANATHAQLA